MKSSGSDDHGEPGQRSRLTWLGGFLGVVIGLVVVVASWPSREHRPTDVTAFLSGATDDSSLITATDAIQNLAGAYLDDGDARMAAETILILQSPRDRHEVSFRLFEKYHRRLNDEVDRATAAKTRAAAGSMRPAVDPDVNVLPEDSESTSTSPTLSSEALLQQMRLLHEFVKECDDTRLQTRCLAKLAETRLDIDDPESPPRRRDLVDAAKSLARSMSQSASGEPKSTGQVVMQWLMVVALPLLTGLAGTAAVKITEAFGSEVGKAFSKVVVSTKDPPAEKT